MFYNEIFFVSMELGFIKNKKKTKKKSQISIKLIILYIYIYIYIYVCMEMDSSYTECNSTKVTHFYTVDF